MEKEAGGYTTKRSFGHSMITWKITNFCFETCKEDFLIHSPEFCVDGLHLTKWKMVLNTKCKQYDEDCFVISLERTGSDTAPSYVYVDLKIGVMSTEGKQCSIPYTNKFGKKDHHKIRLWNILDIRRILKPSSFYCGILTICCHMIVDFDNNSVGCGIGEINDNGIKTLSEDMINLFKVGTNYDIILKTNRNNIYAHKAILFSRSLVLTNLIEKQCIGTVVDMRYYDYETMYDLIEYFYSGNIEYIARRPSLEMYNYATCFDLSDVKLFYNMHSLEIKSAVEINDHTFVWIVKNFKNCYKDYIVSPTFTPDYMDTAWRLSVHVTSMDYVAIHAHIVKGTMPKRGIAHFSVVNDDNNLWFKSFNLPDKGKLQVGDEHFIKRKSLECLLDKVTSDDLNIEFAIEVHKEAVSSRVRYTLAIQPPGSADSYYNIFSILLSNLLEIGKFADITFEVDGVSFRAHKCILSARSRDFASIINEMVGDVLVISNVKSSIFNIVLYYIYSGVYKNFNLEDVVQVYRAAELFSLESLKERCSSILRENLNSESVWEVDILADEMNDVELKNAVIDFIDRNENTAYDKNCKSLMIGN